MSIPSPAVPSSKSPSPAPAAVSPGGTVRQPRVIVVDDDASCRQALGRQLGLLGYAVRLAGSGDEALRLFEAAGADLVLTDLRMPSMGGLELIRRLHQARPDEPVIAFTGGELPAIAECVRYEASGVTFLSKPFGEADLETALRKALGSSEEFWLLWPGGF